MRLLPIGLGIFVCGLAAQDLGRSLPALIVDIRTAPIAVRSGGQYLVQYEVHLTNWDSKPLAIERVEILGPDPLLTLQANELSRAFANGMVQKSLLSPMGGQTALLIALSLDHTPELLTHRIRFRLGDNPEPLTIEHTGTAVHKNTLQLHAPLDGTNWVAANGPAANNHHTGSPMVYQGRVRVPQRFAID